MSATYDPEDVKIAQRLLSTLDYGVLLDNGVLDAKTRQAIRVARADLGLRMSDDVDEELLEVLSREQATRGPRRAAIGAAIAITLLGVGAYFYSRRKSVKRAAFPFTVLIVASLGLGATCNGTQVARGALDVAELSCLFLHDDIQDEAMLAKLCEIAQDLLPEIKKLVSARKAAASKKAAASGCPSASTEKK